MVPDGVTVVSALHTVSAKRSPTAAPLDEDVLDLRRPQGRQGARGAADRADRRPSRRQRRRARDGPHRRDAHGDADLDQRPLQGRTPGIRITGSPRRAIPGRATSSAASILAGGTGGAKLAAGMQDLLGAGSLGDRQHRRRHRDSRRRRLPGPGPDHLLAERRDRRAARLGHQGRLLHRLRSPGQRSARPTGSASPTATSPPACTAGRSSPRAAAAPTPRRRSRARSGCGAAVLPMCEERVRTRVMTAGRVARASGVPDRRPGAGAGRGRRGRGHRRGAARHPRCSRRSREARGDRDRALEPGDLDRPDPLDRPACARRSRPRRHPSSRSAPTSPGRW